jgi:hypothetical protein
MVFDRMFSCTAAMSPAMTCTGRGLPPSHALQRRFLAGWPHPRKGSADRFCYCTTDKLAHLPSFVREYRNDLMINKASLCFGAHFV